MTRKLRVLVLWTCLVAVARFSMAQVGSPMVTNKITSTVLQSRNVYLTTGSSGYSPNQYVSGTNQVFLVEVSLSTGANNTKLANWSTYFLTDATVTIGGQAVESWAATPGSPVTSVSFTVQWDTTHFPMDEDGKGIAEQIKCTADASVSNANEGPVAMGPGAVSESVTVYNVGFSGEISFMEPSWETAAYVDGDLQSMNIFDVLAAPAVRTDAFPPLANATVYYFAGHGLDSPSKYGDDAGSGWWILASDVDVQRMAAEEATLPPLNFAFIDACLTGANDAMGDAFLYPIASMTDRAELGWTIKIWSDWAPPFADNLFDQLEAGMTVSDAEAFAYTKLQHAGVQTQPPQDESDALSVTGDGFTRVHGLYTGQNGPAPTLWYNVTVMP